MGVVLGLYVLFTVPLAKAANDDLLSYEYDLRHSNQQPSEYLNELADDAQADLALQDNSDVAEVRQEETVVTKTVVKPEVVAQAPVPVEKVPTTETAIEKTDLVVKSDSSKNVPADVSELKKEQEMPVVSSDNWMVKPGEEKHNGPIDQLSRQLGIDKALKEAKSIVVAPPVKEKIEPPVTKEFDTQTDVQIIDGLVKPELQNSKIDLDFNEATLSDVFMTLSKSGNINVMLDPVIKDLMVDIHLKQVSIKEAYILLSNAHNLGFKRIEDSLFITTKDKLKEQTVAYKVIKLRNVKAQEVKAMVGDLIKSVNVSEQINSLIVVGQPDEIAKVEGVVKAVDHAQPQVVLEAKIVEVNKDALKDLGVDWSDQISLSYQESGRPVDIPNVATPTESLLNVGAFERNPLSFTSIIKMLENQNKAKVLSNPRVTTMNEKEAEIFVGDRIPYTVTTVSGGVATTDVRFEEPGIRLRITPTIIDGDFVVIKVEPEVSFIFSFRGPDNQYPWVKKRHATAYVRVKNNQPFVLGGLLNQEDKKNLFKVPFIGNVPWLGNIFTYEKHTVTDTELIITITPTVVQGDV
jgi:type II secretory pathway component GspD/PulD (secretin)